MNPLTKFLLLTSLCFMSAILGMLGTLAVQDTIRQNQERLKQEIIQERASVTILAYE